MRCENNFCIYWNYDVCILRETSLDFKGCCYECIYVNIDEDCLKNKREEMLKAYKDC